MQHRPCLQKEGIVTKYISCFFHSRLNHFRFFRLHAKFPRLFDSNKLSCISGVKGHQIVTLNKYLFALLIVLGFSILKSNAQYVAVRPGFSIGISIGTPGPAPFPGAIWVGPEWVWQAGRYVEVPGYWGRPYHHHPTGDILREATIGFLDIGNERYFSVKIKALQNWRAFS